MAFSLDIVNFSVFREFYPCIRLSDVKIDAFLSKDNVRSPFTIWLSQHSKPNDIVFIYTVSHGGGYDSAHNRINGRIDESGDGDKDDWFGVDESLSLNIYQRFIRSIK